MNVENGMGDECGEVEYRVATYSVMKVALSLARLGGGRAERARPKSQIFGGVDELQRQEEARRLP